MTACNPNGGFAGSNNSVVTAGEELEIAEIARELHSACEGPSTCIFKGWAVMVKVRLYSGSEL